MNRIFLVFSLLVLLAVWCAGCGEGSEQESVVLDPFELCLHIFDECDDVFFDGKQSECESHLEPMDRCRQKCIYRENNCDNLDECLFTDLQKSELVQQYCGFTETDGDEDLQENSEGEEEQPLPDGNVL